MSYCRFENTASDLSDCIDAIEEMNYNNGLDRYDDPLSDSEQYAFKSMIDMCKYYLELSERLVEYLDEDDYGDE